MGVAKPKVIVVLGIMGTMPVAGTGVAWNTIQHLVGLRRLGYEVYYVEATGVWPFNASTDDCTFPVTYISQLAEPLWFPGSMGLCRRPQRWSLLWFVEAAAPGAVRPR